MSTDPIIRTILLAALAAPGLAHAGGKVVLAPLLADETINPKQRLAVHQLIASELDFAPEVSGVVDLDVAPPTLNDACIAAAKCLGGITTANGGEQMVSGRMSGSGGNFVLDLVFYDGSQIARRKAFTVPQDPTGLANAMTPIVRELLTGAGVEQKAASSAPSTDFDDEDLSVGTGLAMGDGLVDVADEEPMAAAVPVPVAAKKTTPPPPVPVEPASKKSSKDDQRRLAAAGAATGLAAGVAAGTATGTAGAATRTAAPPPVAAPPPPAPVAAAPPPAPADEDLAKMISFNGSANDITAEDISMIQFGAPPGVAAATPAPVVTQRPAPVSGTSDTRLAEEEAELEKITDLDQGSKRVASASGGSGGPKNVGGGGAELGHIVQITLRGGYSRYYAFDFFTGGGEFAVAVAGNLHLLAGAEIYAVERVLPPELQLDTGIYSQWNFIFPGNLGAIYKFPLGMAQPYVGADTIFVQYYKDEVGADWAIGGRVRAGVDLLVIPNFGFNLNVAVGGWSGQNWGLIEQGVGKAGLLPQVSAGTVFAF